MKTNNFLIFILSLFSLIYSVGCSKHETMGYEGEEGVYFAVQYGAEWGDSTTWNYFPVTKVEFVSIRTDYYTSYIRVASTGATKDFDRQFKMVVERDSTTAIEGINFDTIGELHTIKAGEYFTDVPIVLHKNSNISDIKKRVMLKLEPTADFTLSMPVWNSSLAGLTTNKEYPTFDNTRHYIEMTNFLVRPSEWSGKPLADAAVGTKESDSFGQFTTKKFELMCKVMNENGRIISYVDFTDATTMPSPLKDVIKETMVTYLKKMYYAKTPILENDGRLMFFNGCPWTSNIGIPYVPEV